MPAAPIYLDYQATTPVDPRVLDAMLPYLTHHYGNASSVQHEAGRAVAAAVERARDRVAAAIGALPEEIVFTSGATEANNLALKGFAAAHGRPGHIISCLTEHPAVLEPLRDLECQGWSVTYLEVDEQGRIDVDAGADAMRSDTALVSLMTANNEIGTIHPLHEIAEAARARGIAVHTDGAQAVGKIPLDVTKLGVDLLSISGHKLYAPQGVGALYVRRQCRRHVHPLLSGGGHEGGLRSGTLNAPGIVALGAACEIVTSELASEAARLARQRDRLRDRVVEGWPDVRINGPNGSQKLPGSLHVTFPGTDADAVMSNCEGLAVAAGSACASAAPGPSHVLTAIGMTSELADASIRLSVGRFTTDADVERAAELLLEAVRHVHALMAPTHPAALA
jgi:cysteine desulfurase